MVMKSIFKLQIGILLFAFQTLIAQDSNQYRKMINSAEQSSAEAKIFLKEMNKNYSTTKKPIYLALTGVGNFFQAKHSYNPINKISFFNTGKKMLDDAISLDKSNIEIRFLRYISQKKIPKILGYYQNLEEDEVFLRRHYAKSDDRLLVEEIKRHLNIK